MSVSASTARPPALLVDVEQVRLAFQTFVEPGQIVEVRALEATLPEDRLPYDKPRVISGYFDNEKDFVTALKGINTAEGIYVTIHECLPALLARANNRLKDRKVTTTSDNQIKARRWLFLDLDPVREGDISGIPANDMEHEIALTFACTIRDALQREGWPAPVMIDSGNGAYLLYRIDLPSDDNGLTQRTLQGLAARFDTNAIHVDLTGFNPARIIRLPGTWNRKGDGTDDRPHRQARLIEVPNEIIPVVRELLEVIAVTVQEETPAPAPKVAAPTVRNGKLTSPVDFFQRHNIAYKDAGNGKYILLDGCVFNPEHRDKDAAIIVHDEKWGYHCFHNSCSGKQWRDFRLVFEPDAYDIKPTAAPVKKSDAKVKKEKDLDESGEDTKKPTALELLTEIVSQAKFIVTPGGDLFARVAVNGHHETVSINEKGSGFRRWLIYRFDKENGYIPNSEALTQIMERVKGRASYEGEQARVYTRIAEKNGCVYLDMGNERWECIKISTNGWEVIKNPPVYFRRPNGMGALPYPKRDGCLNDLRQIINVKTEKDFVLIISWLLGTLHPTGPYSVLNLNGERGSGKSKAETYLRNMIDPNEAPARNAPRDEREAAITAQNNMIIALDNLSSMPLWLSDVLCRIATGSGFSTRQMYEDDVEKIFSSKRPIIINGIEDGIISQGDLLSRTIFVTLEPPDKYIAEEDIEQRFQELHPALLGSLLSAACLALRDRRKIRLENAPRMVDFAQWVTAAEPALKWKPGTFMAAFTENQENATSIVTESSPVAKAIAQFMSLENQKEGWYGLTSELHEELKKFEVYEKSKRAPKDATRLSGQINRIKASLRTQGLDIQQPGRTKKGSFVIIRHIPVGEISSAGVAKDPAGVAKNPAGVAKNSLATPDVSSEIEPCEIDKSQKGVAGVASQASLSALLSSANVQKKREEDSKPDRECKIATPATPATPHFDDTRYSEVI